MILKFNNLKHLVIYCENIIHLTSRDIPLYITLKTKKILGGAAKIHFGWMIWKKI